MTCPRCVNFRRFAFGRYGSLASDLQVKIKARPIFYILGVRADQASTPEAGGEGHAHSKARMCTTGTYQALIGSNHGAVCIVFMVSGFFCWLEKRLKMYWKPPFFGTFGFSFAVAVLATNSGFHNEPICGNTDTSALKSAISHIPVQKWYQFKARERLTINKVPRFSGTIALLGTVASAVGEFQLAP